MSDANCTQPTRTDNLTASVSVPASACTTSVYELTTDDFPVNIVTLVVPIIVVLFVCMTALCITWMCVTARRETRRRMLMGPELTASELNLPQKPTLHDIVLDEEKHVDAKSWGQIMPLSVQVDSETPKAQETGQNIERETRWSRWRRSKKKAKAKAAEEAEMDAMAEQRIHTAVMIQMPEPAVTKEAEEDLRVIRDVSIGHSETIMRGVRVVRSATWWLCLYD